MKTDKNNKTTEAFVIKNGFTELKEDMKDGLKAASVATPTDKPSTYDHQALDNAYRNSPLLRKICDKPAVDATSKWRTWTAEEASDIQAIVAEEKRLNVRGFTALCYKMTRQFGGCAIIFHTGEQDYSTPIDFASIGLRGITHLQIIPRSLLQSGVFDADFGSPNHNRPDTVKINMKEGAKGTAIDVHTSRMVIMTGERRAYEAIGSDLNLFFGDATIQSIIPSVQNWESLYKNIAVAGDKFANPILYVDNIAQRTVEQNENAKRINDALKAAGKEPTEKTGTRSAQELIRAINSISGATGTMLLEMGTMKYEILPYNFAGLDPLLERMIKRIAAETGFPLTVLSGEHQPGLGNSGAGDIENYNAMIRGIQEDNIQPSLINLDRALILSALGRESNSACYTWNDLSETPLLDKANIYGIQIDRIIKQVESGLTTEEDGSKAINKLMIEAGLAS